MTGRVFCQGYAGGQEAAYFELTQDPLFTSIGLRYFSIVRPDCNQVV
jgi:hypothetical protein